jgi:hypothetical protein
MTAPPPGSSDWPAQVAGRIESTVGLVRDKTAVPATSIARYAVYGLFAGVIGLTLLLIVVVAVIRIGDVYLPFHPAGRRVWVTDAIVSAIFLVAGAFLWRKRLPRSPSA